MITVYKFYPKLECSANGNDIISWLLIKKRSKNNYLTRLVTTCPPFIRWKFRFLRKILVYSGRWSLFLSCLTISMTGSVHKSDIWHWGFNRLSKSYTVWPHYWTWGYTVLLGWHAINIPLLKITHYKKINKHQYKSHV